jgi:hypothetical protein
VLDARLRMRDAHALPPMFTTAMHGLLGHALESTACLEPGGCQARCKRPDACAYPRLFAPSTPRRAADGASASDVRTPSPLVLSPLDPVLSAQRRKIAADESFGLRVVLIGAEAIAQRSLLTAALRAAATRGLGPPDERVGFVVQSIDEVTRTSTPSAASVELRLHTPLRIVVEGHVRSRFDADALWRAVVRRLRLLHDHCGLPLPDEAAPDAAPFELARAETRIVPIRRWSSRQKARMTWPGVVGTFELRGTDSTWPAAFEWLDLAGAVQIGKGTSFGFGRFELAPKD